MRDSLEYLKGGSTHQFQLGGANYHSTGSLANPQGKTRGPISYTIHRRQSDMSARPTLHFATHAKPPLRRRDRRHRRALKSLTLKRGTTQLREKDRERRARVAEAAASAEMPHTVPLAYSAGGGGRGASPS
ncbi:unnamed protein product [Calypogeia fissa]